MEIYARRKVAKDTFFATVFLVWSLFKVFYTHDFIGAAIFFALALVWGSDLPYLLRDTRGDVLKGR